MRSVVKWVREGPDDSDSLLLWGIGQLLYWRNVAVAGLVTAPFVTGLLAASYAGPFWGVFTTAATANVTVQWSLSVSEKYTLSKHY